jgi:parallel beta-helix repeat protein
MGKIAALVLVALCVASLILLAVPSGKAQLPWRADLPASVHILSDGSVDPPGANVSRVGDVYTLTGDVGVIIIVDKDNVTVDGAGHTLWGNFSGGVRLNSRIGVTVKNLVVKEAGYAFDLSRAADCTIVGNTVANCSKGFVFFIAWRNNVTGNMIMNVGEAFNFFGAEEASSRFNVIERNMIQDCGTGISLGQPNNVVSDNIVTGCYDLGVSLSADFNTLRNNTITSRRVNFEVSGFNNDVDESNTVGGKPLIYWMGHHEETVPSNAGYVVLVNCNNIKAQNLNVEGICVVSTVNSLVTGNVISGVFNMQEPLNNSAFYNDYTIRYTSDFGVQMQESSNVTVSGNSVSGHDYGVRLTNCTGNSVIGNNITGNRYYGMLLTNSNYTTIEGNTVASNGFVRGIFTQGDAFGVSFYDSSFNRFVGNTVRGNNFWGIRVLNMQHDNVIYHNNFIDNKVQGGTLQVSMLGFYSGQLPNPSVWDNGTSGNYWSDYQTRYTNATEVGNSGTGNTPFVINENNIDHYPLMSPYDISVYAQNTPLPSQSPTTSATPRTSESPTASTSASQQPATSSKPNATLPVPFELILASVVAAAIVVVGAVIVFARRHHNRKQT